MKKIIVVSFLLAFAVLFSGAALAYEIPENPPYAISASCGGGCHIQLGEVINPVKGN